MNGKSRLKFSIRFLLLATLLVAIVIAVHNHRGPIYGTIKSLRERKAKLQYHPSLLTPFHNWTDHYFDSVMTVDMTRLNPTDEDMNLIGKLASVENVDVPRGSVSNRGVQQLKNLPALKRFSVWGNHRVNNECVSSLLESETLVVLDVHETNIDGRGLEQLASLPSLQRIVFQVASSGRGFSKAVGKLASVPEAVPVGKMYAGGLDDEGLEQLLAMDTSRMPELMLRGCALTDKGWKRLSSMKLRELDIHFTAISDRQLALLNPDNLGEIQFNFGKDWTKDEVTIRGLSEFLDGRFDEVSFFRNEIDLRDLVHPTARAEPKLIGKLRTKARPLSVDQVQMWKRQNVREVRMRVADLEKDQIDAFRKAGTSKMTNGSPRHWTLTP